MFHKAYESLIHTPPLLASGNISSVIFSTNVDVVMISSAIDLSKSFSLNINTEMRHSVKAVFFFLLTSTFALSLLPPITISPDANNLFKPLSSAFRNLTAGGTVCMSRLGTGLSEVSCQNAWLKIDRHSSLPESFRQRPTSSNTPLPFRYLSDDGICAIDIVSSDGTSGDVSTGMEIAQQVNLLIDHCVRKKHKGGHINYFSTYSLDHVISKDRMPISF